MKEKSTVLLVTQYPICFSLKCKNENQDVHKNYRGTYQSLDYGNPRS